MAGKQTAKDKQDAEKFRAYLRREFEARMDRPAEEIVREMRRKFEAIMQHRNVILDASAWRWQIAQGLIVGTRRQAAA